MNNIDIAIIINSYNRVGLLKKCLIALAGWIPTSEFNRRCTVIIFDAGSTDGSREWLEGEEAIALTINFKVIFPKTGDDTSFAAGLNAGADYAENNLNCLKYLLFYETDNQILDSKPLRQALHQLSQRKKLAGCGFTVRKHDGSAAGVGMPFPSLSNFVLGRNFVHRFQLEAIHYKWERDASGIEFSKVDVVFTSPLLVRLNAWKQSGGLDTKTFPFSDCDVDWARRLSKLGWEMGVIRAEDVIHDNLETLSEWSKTRVAQFHRARLRYFKRYNPIAFFIVWPALLQLRHLAEFMVALTVKDKVRRRRLSEQFRNLMKSCWNGYETA